MDIRLLVDGGASPQAPPGKIAESPPAKEEFEKSLQIARKEENLGEVAEKEPNAQLQKLDPERKAPEAAKKESGTKAPVDPTVVPIKIDPAILAQLQHVGIAQLVMPLLTVSLSAKSAPINPIPVNQIHTMKVDPTGSVVDLKDADKLALAVIASKGNVAKPNLDATSNAAISAMVASAFTNNASPSAKLDPKGFFTEVQAKPTDGPTIQQALGIVATPKGITDARGKLNITSVQCSATSIASQLDSSSSAAKVQPLVNAVIPTGKGVVSTDPKTLAIERDAISVTSTEVAQSGNQKAPSKDRKQDDSQSSNPEMQAPLQTSDVAKPAPTITEYQQTATERQAMVDNISKKIEELAAKSVRNEVRVEMHPPDLGSVVVNIRKDIAGLTATLNASNEPLRQALHESRNDLAGALSDRNVGQIKIEVRGASADNMNMGQQYSQAQQQQNQQNQQNQSKQATLPTGRIISDDKSEIDQPTQRRVSTTLLDMEI